MAAGLKAFFNGTGATINAKAATPVLSGQALETSVTYIALATAVEAGLTVMKTATTYQDRRGASRVIRHRAVGGSGGGIAV